MEMVVLDPTSLNRFVVYSFGLGFVAAQRLGPRLAHVSAGIFLNDSAFLVMVGLHAKSVAFLPRPNLC